MYHHLLLFTFLLGSFTTGLEKDTPLRILTVGDSITQGGKSAQKEYTYRLPLQFLLYSHSMDFDFIGSRRAGLEEGACWPDIAEGVKFDPDHEGYYGYKTATVCKNVMEAFTHYNVYPDFVLIHLGTNDQKEGNFAATIGEPIKDLILFIRQKNPKTVFLLGHLNFNNSVAVEIRSVLEKIAAETYTEGSPVKTVPHNAGWIENPEHLYTDTFDWAHPNLKGQEKMAKKWFEAMEPYLDAR